MADGTERIASFYREHIVAIYRHFATNPPPPARVTGEVQNIASSQSSTARKIGEKGALLGRARFHDLEQTEIRRGVIVTLSSQTSESGVHHPSQTINTVSLGAKRVI